MVGLILVLATIAVIVWQLSKLLARLADVLRMGVYMGAIAAVTIFGGVAVATIADTAAMTDATDPAGLVVAMVAVALSVVALIYLIAKNFSETTDGTQATAVAKEMRRRAGREEFGFSRTAARAKPGGAGRQGPAIEQALARLEEGAPEWGVHIALAKSRFQRFVELAQKAGPGFDPQNLLAAINRHLPKAIDDTLSKLSTMPGEGRLALIEDLVGEILQHAAEAEKIIMRWTREELRWGSVDRLRRRRMASALADGL